MKTFYIVYMLRCADHSYYIGVTSDLQKRLYQHETGCFKTCYTAKRLPIALVYTGKFQYIEDAISWEKQIKKWSKAKKKALFVGDRDVLRYLSLNQIFKNIVYNYRNKKRVTLSLPKGDTRHGSASSP